LNHYLWRFIDGHLDHVGDESWEVAGNKYTDNGDGDPAEINFTDNSDNLTFAIL
jgi:hypothetical protein